MGEKVGISMTVATTMEETEEAEGAVTLLIPMPARMVRVEQVIWVGRDRAIQHGILAKNMQVLMPAEGEPVIPAPIIETAEADKQKEKAKMETGVMPDREAVVTAVAVAVAGELINTVAPVVRGS
jgi:hypothetical protein